jgi:hypothetical protein
MSAMRFGVLLCLLLARPAVGVTTAPSDFWDTVLPKPSIALSDARFSIHLEKADLRMGDFILVTSTIANTSNELQYVPTDIPDLHFSASPGPHLMLINDKGETWRWEMGNHGDGFGMGPGGCCTVGPFDSIYWRGLYALSSFRKYDYVNRTESDIVPGEYWLVAKTGFRRYPVTVFYHVRHRRANLKTVVRRFLRSIGIHPRQPKPEEPVLLTDFTRVTITADNRLEQALAPYAPALQHWAWNGYIMRDSAELAAMSRFYGGERSALDSTYPYLGFILADAASYIDPFRPQALGYARDFISAHPGHPLAEELECLLPLFYYRIDEPQQRDSAIASLLRTYPRNTTLLQYKEGRQARLRHAW